MHAGFATLRNDMSMDLLEPPAVAADQCGAGSGYQRIAAIWREARARFGQGGPFLFGAFSNADAMYAPVATRFRTYGVDLSRFGDDGSGAAYGRDPRPAGDGRVDRRRRRRMKARAGA